MIYLLRFRFRNILRRYFASKMSDFKGYQKQPKYTADEIAQRRARVAAEAAAAAAAANNEAVAQAQVQPQQPAGDRMSNTRWCNCGHCNMVPKNASLSMCVCCKEQDFEGLRQKLDGPDHCIACITQHKDFAAISLTEAVLQMMEAYTRQQRGYGVREGWTNRYVGLLTNFPSPQKCSLK